MTETPALPNEDQLHFPSSWNRHIRPRRGHGKPREVVLDPEPGRKLLAEHEPWLRGMLARLDNAKFARPTLAFLDGDRDDKGAAGVMTLLAWRRNWRERTPRPLLDLLIADYGLPFAAAAVARSLTLGIATRKVAGERIVTLHRMKVGSSEWQGLDTDRYLGDLRSLLAVAPEDQYAAIVAELAQLRDGSVARFATCLVAPDQTDWVTESCREHPELRGGSFDYTTELLLETVTTAEQLRELGEMRLPGYQVEAAYVADLLHRLGADALPVLRNSVDDYYYTNSDLKQAYRAIAAIPSDEAVAYLFDQLEDEPVAIGAAMEAAARFPRRALRAIAARAQGATPEVRKRLTFLLHCDPVLIDAALPTMDTSVRKIVEPLARRERCVPGAEAEALPRLLREPPWTSKGPKRKPVVLDLPEPELERIVWAEGEHDEWLDNGYYAGYDRHSANQWGHEIAAWGEHGTTDGLQCLAYGPLERVEHLVPKWDGSVLPWYAGKLEMRRILARFGTDCLPGYLACVKTEAPMRKLLLPVLSLGAARLMADALARLKTARAAARDWFDRHGTAAAPLLIPDALGRDKRARTSAELALRYLAMRHGADAVAAEAEAFGDEAAAAIRALVDLDPLEPVGVKVPKVGPWAAPAALPQVLLAGREWALPGEAVAHLITVLAVGTPEFPYAGVDVVAESCDRDSLNRFSWALFEQWLLAGAPSADGWALTQLALFADDHTVRALTPLIREWPGENQHARAVRGLEVLGAIGTEAALRAIHGISRKVDFQGIRWKASAQIEAVAANLGLSAEQLADRLVPDFGLGEDSALVLDYGPRRFRVGFDEQLLPFVQDDDGKLRKSLPRPGIKDNAEIANASRSRFTLLKKELRTVATDLVKRLERAMGSGRTWTKAEFDRYYVHHPLVWHLAGRLVWIAEFGGETTAFRLAEDRSYTDVAEDELKLPDDASIRLAHPVLLGDDVSAWADILADYEIIQPFAQIDRPVFRLTDDELRTGRLSRFEGAEVPTGKFLGLIHRGWRRAAPLDAGVEPGVYRRIPGIGYLVVNLDPGIFAGAVEVHPEQVIRDVRLNENGEFHFPEVPVPPKMTNVDPVVVSEALASLAKLTKTD
ncbi:DUF4132 domain-containing protein [Glycomyces buryatensis]|uniref:DUF4132 domain-containing protein n=1 Tax=Glycomyces buryatensis TaxID=2570927 RepID=A0A4S8QBS7_9ACTN|nr:DUF4132 domain-containing protein [Glycomyces buryatensis]THV38509.1 DUF4132 domain-containing protein [Glycomyces buryatensis]